MVGPMSPTTWRRSALCKMALLVLLDRRVNGWFIVGSVDGWLIGG